MSNTTMCTKPIWTVTFKYSQFKEEVTVKKVAALDLQELLSFYNQKGIDSIVKIEKSEDEITYHY